MGTTGDTGGAHNLTGGHPVHAELEHTHHAAAGHPVSGDASERLEALYRREFSRFVRVASALCGDAQSAVDVVQDAFAHALRSAEEYTEQGSFESWVWAIVVNVARNHRRGANRRARRVTELTMDVPAPESSHADVMATRDAIRELPERQRLIVFLRHYGGLTYDEIAQVVGIAPGTVGSSLNHAHAALRSRLGLEDSP